MRELPVKVCKALNKLCTGATSPSFQEIIYCFNVSTCVATSLRYISNKTGSISTGKGSSATNSTGSSNSIDSTSSVGSSTSIASIEASASKLISVSGVVAPARLIDLP